MPLSDEPPGVPQGWIATAVVAVLSAVGGFWAVIRKDRGSAITHLNRVIRGHERYAETLEGRVQEYQKMLAAAEAELRTLKSELTAERLDNHRVTKENGHVTSENDRLTRENDE